MANAKLGLLAASLSFLMINSAALAADDEASSASVAPPPAQTSPPSPLEGLARDAMGDIMELAGILTNDLPRPPRGTNLPPLPNPLTGEATVAAAPDGAPPMEGHMGMGMGMPPMGGPGMGGPPGMCPMGGCPVMMGPRHHHCNPLAMLDGANALTDDQYQKLYDIKGQFIANIVPKGLNMYMLTRKMKDLLTASDIDTKAVKDVEKQIAAGASELSMTAMDSIVSSAQVLTAEQRKEIHTKMIRAAVGGGGGWKHHHHHHEGPAEK